MTDPAENAARPHDPQPAADGVDEQHAGQHEVTLRRAPKVGVFLALGALVGVVGGGVATVVAGFQPGEAVGPTLGYVSLVGGVVGMVLGALVALVLDRRASRRARRFEAERRRVEAEPPVVEGDLEP